MTYRSNRITFGIEWAHCDPAGIVWNPRFFEFFDTGTWRLFEAVLAMPRGELNSHYGIVGFALVEAGSNFMIPLKFGDSAELASSIAEFGRSSFSMTHKIFKNGKLALEGREKRVWAVRHPTDPSRIRTSPIPADVIERFSAAA
ncbi:MAG: acyl-CoA thioesterase [Pseudolabrys sp.]|nr:acyl-CoA thioesterase [Pseudolabrys sp.]